MRTTSVKTLVMALFVAVGTTLPGAAMAYEPQGSPQMEKAKDYIADEQWVRAIAVLRTASADPKEKNRDEALFWLAHSLHQASDLGEAVETIAQLERSFPKSRWVRPARSLRIELAQKLRRSDVLWWTATVPTPPPTPPVPAPPVPPGSAPPRGTPPRPEMPRPVPPPPPGAPLPPPGRSPAGAWPTPKPATPPAIWVSEYSVSDPDLRIQALGSLIQTDAPRVIPMLREIALESSNPHEASRAVFVLAQSGRPEAHSTVLEVARRASGPVSVAAVRELGRFGGPRVSSELLQLYGSGNVRLKYQVVNSLGERAAAGALLQIVQTEADQPLRDAAIVTLGQAGGRTQLQQLYARGRSELKRPIIIGLFNARAEDELIQIADRESDEGIRREVIAHLRLLGTPKAKLYVQKEQVKR
jgi:HEAT repeat protein